MQYIYLSSDIYFHWKKYNVIVECFDKTNVQAIPVYILKQTNKEQDILQTLDNNSTIIFFA